MQGGSSSRKSTACSRRAGTFSDGNTPRTMGESCGKRQPTGAVACLTPQPTTGIPAARGGRGRNAVFREQILSHCKRGLCAELEHIEGSTFHSRFFRG